MQRQMRQPLIISTLPQQRTEAVPFNPFNWFNSATWYDGAGHVEPGQTMAINPVDPDFWNQLVNPQTHSTVHMSMTNPENYGQFMTPQFYMQMANPSVWMKWMNPSVMHTAMDSKTWNYWMQPGAYMHGMNPQAYSQMINPDAWGKMAGSTMASYTGEGELGDWSNMFSGFMSMAMMMPQGMGAYPQASQ